MTDLLEIICPADITVPCNTSQNGAMVTWNTPLVNIFSCGAPVCPTNTAITGFTYLGVYGGHRYYRSTSTMNWDAAKTACLNAGGNLASISSAGENNFIRNNMGGATNVWIGLNDAVTEGTFTWSDGSPLSYTNWLAAEPNNVGGPACSGAGNLSNNDYVVLASSNGRWSDRRGCSAETFIMELSCVTYAVTQTIGPTSGTVFPQGTTTIGYQATSSTGSTATCTFTVTVEPCGPAFRSIAGANTQFEWIDQVEIGEISNPSGNNGGYADYSGMVTKSECGSKLPVRLTPGYNTDHYHQFWTVWVDWNNNGSFTDAGEMVMQQDGVGAIDGLVKVPESAATTNLRMRVAMRWSQYATDPDANYAYGEVEDYGIDLRCGKTVSSMGQQAGNSGIESVLMAQDAATLEADQIEVSGIHPNPIARSSAAEATLAFRTGSAGPVKVSVTDLSGQVLAQYSLTANEGANSWRMPVGKIAAGTYLVELRFGESRSVRKLVVQ
ncbi:MAG: lectin-like protein [Bacteroidia bacterium]